MQTQHARTVRSVLADEIDRLIYLLDIFDGDADLEPEEDADHSGDEPSLGTPELSRALQPTNQTYWSEGSRQDAELDTSDFEPYLAGAPFCPLDAELDPSDDEPSLGSFDRMLNQENWSKRTVAAAWASEDAELDRSDYEDGGDTEPNGDERDENGDERDMDANDQGEPNLGSSELNENESQEQWARGGYGNRDRCDLEEAVPVCDAYRRVRVDLEQEVAKSREASARLREIIVRLSGVPAGQGNLREVDAFRVY